VWFPFSIVPAVLIDIIIFPLLVIAGVFKDGILGVFSAARTATPIMWDIMENSPYPRGARLRCNYGDHGSLPLFVPRSIWMDKKLRQDRSDGAVAVPAVAVDVTVIVKDGKAVVERRK